MINNKSVSFSFADDVSINDEVLVHGEDKVIPEKVINITNLEMQGNFQSYTSLTIGITKSMCIRDPSHSTFLFEKKIMKMDQKLIC